MQPGYPGQDPYGQQPQDPYGQPQQPPQYGQDPYGQQPQSGPPYGQPQSGPPYGQPQSGPPQYSDPYAVQQPQYGQDPYGQQPMSGQPYPSAPQYPGGYGAPVGQSNTVGLLAMIFGIIAAVLGLCGCSILAIPLGIAAAILGFIGKGKADQGQASNRGQSLAGLITGAAGVVLSIIWIVLTLTTDIATFYGNLG